MSPTHPLINGCCTPSQSRHQLKSRRSRSRAGNFASMATATATPPVNQDEERAAKERKRAAKEQKRAEEEQILRERAEERRTLRKEQLENDLQDLEFRHQEERRALLQELRELADARKAIQDQLCATDQQRKLSAELPTANRCLVELGEEEAASKLKYEEHEGGASSSTAGTALNGKEGPREGDKEISYCAESSWKPRHDEEKQALLKDLPEKDALRVELQHLLKDLEIKALRDVYEFRIEVEDPREIKAHQRTLAAKQAGLWRFVSKKVEAKRRVVELMESAKDDIAYVDEQKLGYPKLPECFEEIKKLFDIEQNPIFSKTLQEWKQEKERLILQLDRIHNRLASVKNEVYQVIGFFSVFQGVLLTAVAQSSLLHCHNKWSPIVLSVLASVISTFGIIQKWNQIIDLQIAMDYVTRAFATAELVRRRLQEPGLKGINFVHLNVDIESYYSRRSEFSKNRRGLTWLYFVLLILTVVAFVVLFPISFWRILCKPGSPAP